MVAMESQERFDRIVGALKAGHEEDKLEAAECILFLQDASACRMASTWKRVKRLATLGAGDRAPGDEDSKWIWAWAAITYDLREWAAISAVAVPHAKSIERVLIANRVIYPDGTVNTYAGKWIGEKVVGLISKRKKGKGK